jgi:predicted nucleic acid-binding protein
MFLLDTNVLSELMKPSPDAAVISWLDQHPASALFISAVTRAEIELGIALLPDGQRKRRIADAADRMFSHFSGRCLAFGEMAAVDYGRLVAERLQHGRPITTEDAQIAAIALVYGLRLVTRNVKDFENIAALTTVNPWQ